MNDRDFSVKINCEHNSENTIFIFIVDKKRDFYVLLAKRLVQKMIKVLYSSLN